MRQLDLFPALQSSTERIETKFKSERGGMPGSFWESYPPWPTPRPHHCLGVAEKPADLVSEGGIAGAEICTV